MQRIPYELQRRRIDFEVPQWIADIVVCLTVEEDYEGLIKIRDALRSIGFKYPFVNRDYDPDAGAYPGTLDYESALGDEIY